MTVLVVDSGIGGLSILREARVVLPMQRFVYVGDDAGFPYGDWQEAELIEHIVALFERLLNKYQPDVAIVACNTASTLIMPALRERFDVPIVGTVPAIKPAAERTRSGMISVLGTPGTIKRSYIQNLINEFASDVDVNLVAASGLAQIAEDYMQNRDFDAARLLQEIAPCFQEVNGRRTDIVVLGCTHYPFLANQMRKLAPWPVDWIDPSEAIALQSRSVLDALGLTFEVAQYSNNLDPDLAVMTSGAPSPALGRILRGFGFKFTDEVE